MTVEVRSLEGEFVTLSDSVISSLVKSIRGEVIRQEDPGYHVARRVWNAMIDRRPALIIRCICTNDVITGVNFARETNVLLSIKGGGHNVAGLAVADGAILLDLSLMRGVDVDAEQRTARAQAGCTLGDVDRETQIHGLAAVLGFVSQTGIAGLTLGGGFGYLTKRYGWACDGLRSVKVVTAEGRLVRASATEEPDLFWALKGGGGNFGVATSFEYELHPVGPEIVGGAIVWPGENAESVMEMYQHIVETSPPEMVCSLGLRVGSAPWASERIAGKPILVMTVCDHGEPAAAEKRISHIRSVGTPVEDLLGRRSYISMQSLFDAAQPDGRRHYWKAEHVAGLDQGMIRTAFKHAAEIPPSSYSRITFFPIRGRLNELSRDESAVGNRSAGILANVWGSWADARDDELNMNWTRRAWADLRSSSVGIYVNMLSEDDEGTRIEHAYGSNFTRLTELKIKYDPHNMFRVNKNIVPS